MGYLYSCNEPETMYVVMDKTENIKNKSPHTSLALDYREELESQAIYFLCFSSPAPVPTADQL